MVIFASAAVLVIWEFRGLRVSMSKHICDIDMC